MSHRQKKGSLKLLSNQLMQQNNMKLADSSHKVKQAPPVLNSAPVIRKVYLLNVEDGKRMAIKEVSYVDLSRSASGQTTTMARPFWVPAHIPQDCWNEKPACFWKINVYPLKDLDTSAGKLIYNPLADYSLELLRCYRPDLFKNIFQLFRIWCKQLYTERQLAHINQLLLPEKLPLKDFRPHFNLSSPVAPTLKAANFEDDILPHIEHYLGLLTVRSYINRKVIEKIR